MSRTPDQARHLFADAHIVATDIDAAIRALQDSRGGYPSSTPGAAPSTSSTVVDDPEGRVNLTQPERDAMTIDRARLDHIALTLAVRRAAAHTAKAAAIVNRWANPADTDTSVAKKLAGAERDIWCRNCATHGVNNVSEPNRIDCKFCATIRRTYGTPPNRALLELHGYRNVSPQDVVRIFDRDVDGWRKNRPRPKASKRKGKAA